MVETRGYRFQACVLRQRDDLIRPGVGGEIYIRHIAAQQIISHRATDGVDQIVAALKTLVDQLHWRAVEPLAPNAAHADCAQSCCRLTMMRAVAPQM